MTLHASGASVLRVRLRRDEAGALSLTAADPAGSPVVTVGSLVTRPVEAGQLETAAGAARDALFTVEWVPVPALRRGGDALAGVARCVGERA